MLRTVAFTGVALLFEVVLGMAVALLLWRPFRGEKWVRAAILLPLVATPVAVGMMWRLLLDPNIGFANQLLGWEPDVALHDGLERTIAAAGVAPLLGRTPG